MRFAQVRCGFLLPSFLIFLYRCYQYIFLSHTFRFLRTKNKFTDHIIQSNHNHLCNNLYQDTVHLKLGNKYKQNQFFKYQCRYSSTNKTGYFFDKIAPAICTGLKHPGPVCYICEYNCQHPRSNIRCKSIPSYTDIKNRIG